MTFNADKVAMLVEYRGAVQLDVLCVETTNQRLTFLNVVEQTLGHKRVFVEVHQVSGLASHHSDRSYQYRYTTLLRLLTGGSAG